MKIKNFIKYFKEGVLKYFKISMKIFQSEIFNRASLITIQYQYHALQIIPTVYHRKSVLTRTDSERM